jgi:hypothetical protein
MWLASPEGYAIFPVLRKERYIFLKALVDVIPKSSILLKTAQAVIAFN